jgi:hypothetical protein
MLLAGYISADLIKKVLLGAGIGIASGAFFNTLLTMYITKMMNSLGGIPASILGLLGKFGFDQALSVIIGALACRAAINAMQLSFTKS